MVDILQNQNCQNLLNHKRYLLSPMENKEDFVENLIENIFLLHSMLLLHDINYHQELFFLQITNFTTWKMNQIQC